MRWLTPWGTSLFLHVLLVLVLALLFVSSGGESLESALSSDFLQLRDDLTSVSPDDISGDPFTTLDAAEPPSLTFDTSPTEVTNTPELPADILIEQSRSLPGLIGPTVDVGVRMGGLGTELLREVELVAPFQGRQGPNRAKLVRREGGTVESEEAVERGLDWIVRHQRADGGWSLDTSGECEQAACPLRPSMQSDTAATGLALLPLLGAGADHLTPGRYQDAVDNALDWLVAQQRADGDLYTGGAGNAHMYSHAIAAMALCEAYGITKDPKLRVPAEQAIQFILASQNIQDGGWRYSPGQAGDTSVLGWQVFALRSANLAGMTVPMRSVQGITSYLNAASADALGATYAYQPGRRANAVMTAEALVVRQILGWPARHSGLNSGARQVALDMMQIRERNIYYWYYGTQLLHNLKGPAWERWNPTVRDGLVKLQVRGTHCDRGSWDPVAPVADRWGRQAGRLFTTSLSVLTLEVYYRYLPLYRTTESDPIESGEKPTPASDG